MTDDERIRAERAALKLKPWQFAPSEVDDGPSPYPPGTAGYTSWLEAQAMRRELQRRKGEKGSGDE